MNKLYKPWPKLKRNIEEFKIHLNRWFVLASQDDETKKTIHEFRRAYNDFLKIEPSKSHVENGIETNEIRNIVYLHKLLRITEKENTVYKDLLENKFSKYVYEKDILDLAQQLYYEYQEINITDDIPSPEGFFYRNVKRALKSLNTEQLEFLYQTNSFDHVSALLMYLVHSKFLLEKALQNIGYKIKVGVVIPIHKESERLKDKKETFAGENFFDLKINQLDYLLIDNEEKLSIILYYVCSDNKTYSELDQKRKKFEEKFSNKDKNLTINVIKNDNEDNNSKATNVMKGLRKAEESCDYIAYTDADSSTNLGQLGILFYNIIFKKADVAIGSRRTIESWVYGRDAFRTKQSKIYNFIVHLFLGLPIKDTQAGIKLFTLDSIKSILSYEEAGKIKDKTMAFDTELLTHLYKINKDIVEVPIVWFESPLESKSAGFKIAYDMFIGLFEQSKSIFKSKPDDQADRSTDQLYDENIKQKLLKLGINEEFYFLSKFVLRYYDTIQPYYLREFVDTLKTVLYALSKNELTEKQFLEFKELFQDIVNKILSSKGLSFINKRYPEIIDIGHFIWQNYRLGVPILCFLFGSDFLAKVLPKTAKGVKSFFEFSYNQELLNQNIEQKYEAWIEYFKNFRYSKNEEKAIGTRKELATTQYGRIASTRKLLKYGDFNNDHIHLIIPAMGINNQAIKKYCFDKNENQKEHFEITNIKKKINDLTKLYQHVEQNKKPTFHFHFVTGIIIEKDKDKDNLGILKGLQEIFEKGKDESNKFNFFFYMTDGGNPNKSVFHRYENEVINNFKSIEIETGHRNIIQELKSLKSNKATKIKGTLLYIGFKVVQRYIQEIIDDTKQLLNTEKSNNHFVGYTVTTSKIPIEEYIFLLRAIKDIKNNKVTEDPENSKKHNIIALGSRRLPDSEVTNKPLLNHIRSAVLNLLIRALYPDLADLTDTQASCKLMTLHMLNEIFSKESSKLSKEKFQSVGVSCDVEILQLAKLNDGKIIEVPISFYESGSMVDSIDFESSTDILSSVLELRGKILNLNQKPYLVKKDQGKEYTVQYIGCGTENNVFLITDKTDIPDDKKCNFIVKIPHEAFDTKFYLTADSLCFNKLRIIGFSKQTSRDDSKGLIVDNPLIKHIQSMKNKTFSKWIDYLRKWGDLNGVVLKLIRAYEGKTYKSLGYDLGNVRDKECKFILPYRKLSENEYIDLEEKGVYDGLDNVYIMKYYPYNIESYLRKRIKENPEDKESIKQIFIECITAAYSFSNSMANKIKLYDLDMNMWSDIGIKIDNEEDFNNLTKLEGNNLILIDPGELVELEEKNKGENKCTERIRNKLEIKSKEFDLFNDELEKKQINYDDHNLFNAFQFKQLNSIMDQYDLEKEYKDEIKKSCVEQLKGYYKRLYKLCESSTPSLSPCICISPESYKNDKVNNEIDNIIFNNDENSSSFKANVLQTNDKRREKITTRYKQQIASVMFGGEIQGKFQGYKDISIEKYTDYNVYLSQRGLPIRKEKVEKEFINKYLEKNTSKLLLVNRENLEIESWNNNKLTRQDDIKQYSEIPKDKYNIPYRGAMSAAIYSLNHTEFNGKTEKDKEKLIDKHKEIDVVLLNAGVSSRMSLISYSEKSKGNIFIQDEELWEKSAIQYKYIADSIKSGEKELIIFGAADNLLMFNNHNDVQNNEFLSELKKYFEKADHMGQKPGIFFFKFPSKKDSLIILPYTSDERDKWITNYIPEWFNQTSKSIPILHLFSKQINKLKEVDKDGFGIWYNKKLIDNPTDKKNVLKLPKEFKIKSKDLLKYALISNVIENHGGLRFPFLFIINKNIIKELYEKFFKDLDAVTALRLDWFNTFVIGMLTDEESLFIESQLNNLTIKQAKKLYGLLTDIKKTYFNEYHQKQLNIIINQFIQDLSDNIQWYAFESPVDIFNYYIEMIQHEEKNGASVYCNFSDKVTIENSVRMDNKKNYVVVAGKPTKINGKITINLNEPTNDITKRSNFYPYLIYIAKDYNLDNSIQFSICPHELVLLTQKEILKTNFVHLSKEATMSCQVLEFKDKNWVEGTETVKDYLKRP